MHEGSSALYDSLLDALHHALHLDRAPLVHRLVRGGAVPRRSATLQRSSVSTSSLGSAPARLLRLLTGFPAGPLAT